MSLEELQKLSEEDQLSLYKKVDSARKKGKSTNYSAMYKVGAAKLARELKISVIEAKKLLDAFWKKNWAIKAIAEAAEIKTVNGQMWVKNPISGFWISLRHEKDIWSTINQSSGVYCFDMWVKNILQKRPQLTATFHDEVILEIKKGNREKATQLLKEAMDKTNEKLQLNVQLGCDVQFGDRYSSIH